MEEKNIVSEIERIIKQNITTIEIDGKKYTNQDLHIVRHKDMAHRLEFGDLSSLVSMIKNEIVNFKAPLFVNVESPTKVSVFTALDDEKDREEPYIARFNEEIFNFGRTYNYEDFVIALRSKFVLNDDIQHLLELLKKTTNAQSLVTEDDGITQRVVASQGSHLATDTQVTPIRCLSPFRTFNEVAQPTSEFLFRMRDSGSFALYEADGGAWKKTAKDSIKEYFAKHLSEEIEKGQVVVVS